MPVAWSITGTTTFGSKVNENFKRDKSRATWLDSTGKGQASTDYRVLSGAEEARSAMASSSGWLAARTVQRQERAYQGLICLAILVGMRRVMFRLNDRDV